MTNPGQAMVGDWFVRVCLKRLTWNRPFPNFKEHKEQVTWEGGFGRMVNSNNRDERKGKGRHHHHFSRR